MKQNLGKIIPTILVIGLTIFLLCYIRSCNQNSDQVKAISALKEKSKADSIKSSNNQKRFDSTIHSVKADLDSTRKSKRQTEDSLDQANKRIDKLLARYKPVKVDNDTGNTYVPNEFINDCSDCFNELPHYKNLVNNFRSQVHVEDSIHKKQDTAYEKRIAQLGKEKAAILFSLNECLNSKQPQNESETGGILFGNISAMSINNFIPSGLGIGLIFQDGRLKQYGFNVFNSKQGQIYTVNVSAPFIKFKRRK